MSDSPLPADHAYRPKMPALFNPENPTDSLLESAEVRFRVKNEKVADALQVGLHQVFDHMKGVKLTATSDQHKATLEINHNEMAEQWLGDLKKGFIGLKTSEGTLKDVVVAVDKKTIRDDASRLEITIDVKALAAFKERRNSGQYEVTDILDESNIPTTPNDIGKMFGEELLGINPENGNFVINGQTALKLLQGILNVPTEKTFIDKAIDKHLPDSTDDAEKKLTSMAEKFPGMTVTKSDEDHVVITIDSGEISKFLRKNIDTYMPHIKGIKPLEPAQTGDEAPAIDPYTSHFSVDFRELTDGVIFMAGALLNGQKGVKILPDATYTSGEVSTDSFSHEFLMGVIKQAQRRFAGEIADAARDQKPSGKLDVVVTLLGFFGRGKTGPGDATPGK